MMHSITLQSSDTVITSPDVIGRLNFAASSESDGGAGILIVAGVKAQAEGAYTASSNPTSIVLSTAAADSSSAVERIKISEDGHLLPVTDISYNLGSSSLIFKDSHITSGTFYHGIILSNQIPATTTNALYNNGGSLYFNGSSVGGGTTYSAGSGITIDGADKIHLYGVSGQLDELILRNYTPSNVASGLYSEINYSTSVLHFNGSGVPHGEPIVGNATTSGVLNMMITDQATYDSLTKNDYTLYFIV